MNGVSDALINYSDGVLSASASVYQHYERINVAHNEQKHTVCGYFFAPLVHVLLGFFVILYLELKALH